MSKIIGILGGIDALLRGTQSPLPEMRNSAKKLEKAGADFIIIPCHTAHYWVRELRQNIRIPIYSIVDATSQYIRVHRSRFHKGILLLGSEATTKLGLYNKKLSLMKVKLFLPNCAEQKIISSAINEVKGGRIKTNSQIKPINQILKNYITTKGLALLAGCSETSLLLPYLRHNTITIVSSMTLGTVPQPLLRAPYKY